MSEVGPLWMYVSKWADSQHSILPNYLVSYCWNFSRICPLSMVGDSVCLMGCTYAGTIKLVARTGINFWTGLTPEYVAGILCVSGFHYGIFHMEYGNWTNLWVYPIWWRKFMVFNWARSLRLQKPLRIHLCAIEGRYDIENMGSIICVLHSTTKANYIANLKLNGYVYGEFDTQVVIESNVRYSLLCLTVLLQWYTSLQCGLILPSYGYQDGVGKVGGVLGSLKGNNFPSVETGNGSISINHWGGTVLASRGIAFSFHMIESFENNQIIWIIRREDLIMGNPWTEVTRKALAEGSFSKTPLELLPTSHLVL